jgi:hypothetical protein
MMDSHSPIREVIRNCIDTPATGTSYVSTSSQFIFRDSAISHTNFQFSNKIYIMARHPISSIQDAPVRITSNSKCVKMAPRYISSADINTSSGPLCSRFFGPLQRKSSLFGETSTGSSSTESSGHEVASAHRIRSRYLHKLGVGTPASSPLLKKNSKSNNMQSTETLKDDLGRTDSTLTSSSSTPQHSKHNASPKVRFLPQVSVHSIPHRNQYSSKVKQLLWMAPQELEEAACRNYIEFAAEQWDWRQAAEESNFVLIQGVSTHPAHAQMLLQQQQQQRSCTPNRQFCMVFSAQQQLSKQQHYQPPQTVGYRR